MLLCESSSAPSDTLYCSTVGGCTSYSGGVVYRLLPLMLRKIHNLAQPRSLPAPALEGLVLQSCVLLNLSLPWLLDPRMSEDDDVLFVLL